MDQRSWRDCRPPSSAGSAPWGPGLSLRTFFYPGILGLPVLMTAMMAAASVVWDREYGFLREMLVAPVRRGSLVLGKCLGGAVIAGFEGLVVIAIAGLVKVPYNLRLPVQLFGIQLLLAFTICAFGMMMASRIQQMESFMARPRRSVLLRPEGPRGGRAACGLWMCESDLMKGVWAPCR